MSSLPGAGAAPPGGPGTARSPQLPPAGSHWPDALLFPGCQRRHPGTFEALGSQVTAFPWGWLRACAIREPPASPTAPGCPPVSQAPVPWLGDGRWSGALVVELSGAGRGVGAIPGACSPGAAGASPNSCKPGDTPSAPVTHLYVRGCPPFAEPLPRHPSPQRAAPRGL